MEGDDRDEAERWADPAGSCGTVCHRSDREAGAGGDEHCLHIFFCGISVGVYERPRIREKDLVKRIMEHYTGVTEEKAAEDVEKFLKILADNNIMEDGVKRGGDFTRIPKEMLDKLWPSNGMSEKDTGDEVD